MNGDKAWEIIFELCKQYTTVPSKRIFKLARYIAIENARLKKENKKLKRQLRGLRNERA